MKNSRSILFRAEIRVYLSSGDSFELAERISKVLSDKIYPLINEIGLSMKSETFDQYENEICEMNGCRQPVISFQFENHVPTLDISVDYTLFLRSLARLMDARYPDVRVCYEPDKSALYPSGPHPENGEE